MVFLSGKNYVHKQIMRQYLRNSFPCKNLTNLMRDIFPGILQPTLTSLRCAASLLTVLEIASQTSALGDGVSIPGMVGYMIILAL